MECRKRAACMVFRVFCGGPISILNRATGTLTYGQTRSRPLHARPAGHKLRNTHTRHNEEDINPTAIVEILLTKPDLENMRQMCCLSFNYSAMLRCVDWYGK